MSLVKNEWHKIESAETSTAIVPMDIRPLISEIRGRQVMLDRDLAAIYQVLTKRLNEQVQRNIERFPDEFMFQLTKDGMNELVANCDRFKTMKHSSVVTLDMLAKRGRGVKVELVMHSNGELAESDFEAFAKQCGNFMKTICGIWHEIHSPVARTFRGAHRIRIIRSNFDIILSSCERAAADTKVLPPPQAG